MKNIQPTQIDSDFAAELRADLYRRYGELIGGADLRRLLGFRTAEAMRQGLVRQPAAIPLFQLPGRRGRFALSRDVADWLAQHREAATTSIEPEGDPK